MTYTYVIMEVPEHVYLCIRENLLAAGWTQAVDDKEQILDMHGLALAPEEPITLPAAVPPRGTALVVPLRSDAATSVPEDPIPLDLYPSYAGVLTEKENPG
jgi:hypothetical protein